MRFSKTDHKESRKRLTEGRVKRYSRFGGSHRYSRSGSRPREAPIRTFMSDSTKLEK